MIDVRTYRASTLSYINNSNYKVTLLSKYEIKEIPESHQQHSCVQSSLEYGIQASIINSVNQHQQVAVRILLIIIRCTMAPAPYTIRLMHHAIRCNIIIILTCIVVRSEKDNSSILVVFYSRLIELFAYRNITYKYTLQYYYYLL